MGISDRLLMGPGPSNAYPEVTMALAGPVLGHLDPQFLAMLDSTNDRLRQVFATSNALTLPLSGTGSAGMEASFVNFVRPGDPVVVGVNGVFGERMCEVACRHGADVLRVDADWGEPVDPDRLLGAHPAPAMIAFSPRSRAVAAYSNSRSGVRCADTTRTSCAILSASKISTAACIVSQSDDEPIITPTKAFMARV